MNVLDAIKNIEAKAEAAANYQKTNWLKLADGQQVVVRFPNEITEDSPNYDEARGVAWVIEEHTNPRDFRVKAQCTERTDGRCWACEQHAKENNPNNKEYKGGWKARPRFYTNVLVNDGNDTYVAVWSQGVSKKSAINFLIEQNADTGSISNTEWKLKRIGERTETSYILRAGQPDEEPFDWSGVELFDLQKVVRQVPYAEQEGFYLGFDNGSGSDADATSSASINW
jgi:hypothetical protein